MFKDVRNVFEQYTEIALTPWHALLPCETELLTLTEADELDLAAKIAD